jgi:K+-sensing histidine kinase KdpD
MADESPPETTDRFGDVRYALTTLALAFATMGAAVALKGLLLSTVHANAGFVIYVPAVAVVAWYRGLLGGIAATLIGAFADAALFTPALAILQANVDDLQVRLAAYITGGVAVSYLSHKLRTERDRARVESGERRRALQRAAEMSDELRRRVTREQQQTELRAAFNSIVSHELRTPITAIYGGAKVLARRNRELDETTRQELIDDLEAEADRLYRLVEDLLVLSRSEYGTVERADEPVALARVVERVANSEQARWPGVRFVVRAASVPTARGDETYVEQVTRNLLGNAAKYSPAGSTVEVEVDETEEGVRTRVLDAGVGIKAEEAERLFELYYRSPDTARMATGAGIGLYVCRALVEAMGGRIWAAARPTGGAEFGFVLGRYEEDSSA